jgi:hypothetical protein
MTQPTRIKQTVRGDVVTTTFRALEGDTCDKCGQLLGAGDRVGLYARTGKPSHVNARKCKRQKTAAS